MNSKKTCVGIAILNYRSATALKLTLRSVACMETDTPVICAVLDNGSPDCEEAQEAFAAFRAAAPDRAGAFIANPENLGFSGGNNVLIRRFLDDLRITHILLANPDICIPDHAVDRLVETNKDAVGPVTNSAGNMQTVEIGCSVEPNEDSLRSVNRLSAERFVQYSHTVTDVPMLVFFCTLLSRELIEQVGLLDARFFPGSFEDDDYCIRIRRNGYAMYCARGVFVYHWGSQSFSKLAHEECAGIADRNKRRLEEKWERKWEPRVADPLKSCGQDVTALLEDGRTSCSEVGNLQRTFSIAEQLILDQNAAIEYLRETLFAAEQRLAQTDELDDLKRLLAPTPIRRRVAQVSGKDLFRQIAFILKKRMIRLFRGAGRASAFQAAMPEQAWNKQGLLFFDEACAQLIERIAFRLSKPLHERAERKEQRQQLQRSSDNDAALPGMSVSMLRRILHDAALPTVMILAPYPTEENEKDGYFKRVRAVDTMFAKEYFRVYITMDAEEIPSETPIMEILDTHVARVRYNVCNEAHIDAIGLIAYDCAFLYTHSILQVNKRLLDRVSIPKILDVHGSVPEEAALCGDTAGEAIYGAIERYAVETYDAFVFVTDAMKTHLETKYDRRNLKGFVMPTFDGLSPKNAEPSEEKRSGEVSVLYSGGTQAWQKLDKVYEAVAARPGYAYCILTPDTEKVRAACDVRGISGAVRVDGVSPDRMSEEYRKFHYGFMLRDDIVVNRVACPTKLIEYLSFGVVPIVCTPNIGDFGALGMRYVTYADFMAGSLPDAQERLRMAQENFALSRTLQEAYRNGRQQILAFGRACRSAKEGLPKTLPEGPMAVGLVVTTFVRGGLEQVVLNVYRGLKARGIPAYLLVQENDLGEAAEGVDPGDLMVFAGDEAVFIGSIREKGINVLHYHYNTFLLERMSAAGLRTFYTLHNVYTWKSDAELAAYARILSHATGIVAVSRYVGDYFVQRAHYEGANICTVLNGIDLMELRERVQNASLTRSALKLDKDDIVFAFVASFYPVKGQIGMIGAMEQLCKRVPRARLLFVGNVGEEGYYRQFSECLSRSPAKDAVRVIPYFEHRFMGEFLRSTVDAAVLPTLQEGCSNVVLEALCCDRPLILTDTGCARDVSDLSQCTVVPPPYADILSVSNAEVQRIAQWKDMPNQSQLVDAMCEVANDLDHYARISRMTERQKDRFGVDHMVDEYVALFRNAENGRPV